MTATPDRGRLRFLGKTAMTLVAARFGLIGTSGAHEAAPRHLEALGRATDWLNSAPLPAASLLGKVVLVQFGTYTCINWLRTLPHVRAWTQKYQPGMVTVGVHTPEFQFEKRLENVRRAMQDMKVNFPIAVDNDYAIWRAFDNRYWPALYFIDARGRIREHQFGEGAYEQSERIIRRLLAEVGYTHPDEAAAPLAANAIELPADWRNLKSPETYLGHARIQNFASPGGATGGRPRAYAVPARLALNQWALAGEWTIANEASTLRAAQGRLVYRFHARDVHLVMGPVHGESPVRFRIALDGQRPGVAHGLDVDDSGAGTISDQRLYQLIRQPGAVAARTLEIEFLDPGVELFAFTFG